MRQISWVLISVIVVAGASFPPESGAQSGGDGAREAGAGTILRVDPRFDALVPADARIEKIADGFVFIEGPIWLRDEGRLLFSAAGSGCSLLRNLDRATSNAPSASSGHPMPTGARSRRLPWRPAFSKRSSGGFSTTRPYLSPASVMRGRLWMLCARRCR